jgi:hypothetical protein
MLPADKVIVMYRDKLREWDARGWRIDMDEVLRNIKKVAYAVPGPARRAAKGWVLDEVPRLNGQAADI